MFGGEWFALSKKRQPELDKFEDSIWTFLVKDKNQFNDSCYLSVLDLFTENWKYIFERNEKLRLSSFATPINWNPPTYEFTKIIKLRFRKSLKLINTSVRFRIALERWFSSYTRNTSYLDSLLDCCSALEAILGVRDEIRLRISLSTFYILSRKINKSQAKKAAKTVYEMYNLRNIFIHGSKIPEVRKEEIYDFINTIAELFKILILNSKLPSRKELEVKVLEII